MAEDVGVDYYGGLGVGLVAGYVGIEAVEGGDGAFGEAWVDCALWEVG